LKENPRMQLVLIERDRIKRTVIREIFAKVDIKSIDVTKEGVDSFYKLILGMPPRYQQIFYYEMALVGQNMMKK
jgi:hypothetical protein